MKKELNIKITVDRGQDEIVVTDDAGNITSLKSIMLVGGSFESKGFYCVSAGSSADLGWALGNAYRYTRMSSRPEEGHLRRAFHQMLMWVATFFGWGHGEEIDPEVLLKRWAEQDKRKAEEESTKIKYIN